MMLRSIVLLVLGGLPSALTADAQPWLLVDTGLLTVTVMQDDHPQLTLYNLARGRYGTTTKKFRGDEKTPLGRFRVTQIESSTAFYRFVRLSYPDAERAILGRMQGDLSEQELQAILSAHRDRKPPPQSTLLGGQIGIHGLGKADSQLHETMHWTRGCIALTDRQIESLLPWLEIGMEVEIR
jgi:murein L,D-transpeptidase YafK